MTAEPRRHQFYGRRSGHALRPRQRALTETLLPRLRVDLDRLALNPDRDTWLEIGFGGGEHLAEQARLHPSIDFLGAEPFINGIAKLLSLIEERGLRNIRIHDDDARYLLEVLPDRSLARIFLLYPDPWPKARHARRRFVCPENLDQFRRALKPDGQFLFASDSAEYVDWTREQCAAHGGFALLSDTPDPPNGWIKTRYEAKAVRAGRMPRYLTYRSLSVLRG